MKTLIAYFSWSGNTKEIVDELNKEFKFDIIKIERLFPYSKDYQTTAYVEAKEEWEKRLTPDIKKINVDLNNYERILLFFPIWWYTTPMPVATFVSKNLTNYKGEVLVFANSYTNDPLYMANSIKDLKALNTNLNIKEGLLNKPINEHIKIIKEEI